MGIMDKMKSNMSGMSDDMKARYSELCAKEDSNTLDDQGRIELQQMRDRMKS